MDKYTTAKWPEPWYPGKKPISFAEQYSRLLAAGLHVGDYVESVQYGRFYRGQIIRCHNLLLVNIDQYSPINCLFYWDESWKPAQFKEDISTISRTWTDEERVFMSNVTSGGSLRAQAMSGVV